MSSTSQVVRLTPGHCETVNKLIGSIMNHLSNVVTFCQVHVVIFTNRNQTDSLECLEHLLIRLITKMMSRSTTTTTTAGDVTLCFRPKHIFN